MCKTGKRLGALILVLALTLCPFCPAAQAGDIEDMIARVKLGVVQIYSLGYDNGRCIGGGSGSGFAVGSAGKDSDVFVTNWHVVTGNGEFDPAQSKVYIALDNSTLDDALQETDRVIPCEVLYITHGNPDFAILRATRPIVGFKALPLMSSDKIMDGAHVTALGYPGVVDDYSATSGGMNDMTVTQGSISRHSVGTDEIDRLAGVKLLISDAMIDHGNSGGALVNDAGAVVGINTYGFDKYTGSVYIDYVMEALDDLGIHYDVYKPGSLSTPAIVVIAIGAVLLILGAVLLLRRKNRVPVTVGAAPAPVNGAARLNRERASGFTLLGPEGLNRAVPASGLVIGRDPAQCGLCLPNETKGVSRRHCQLTPSGQGLLLTDLGSSYGTFLNGRKLTPNSPATLLRGDSFWLGSESVRFKLQ